MDVVQMQDSWETQFKKNKIQLKKKKKRYTTKEINQQ